MKKLSKTFITLFIAIITVFSITVNNNTRVASTDDLTTAEKIQNSSCLASLNMSYNIDYNITEGDTTTYSKVSTDISTINKEVDFATNYFGITDDKLTMIVYSNDGSTDSFNPTNGISLTKSNNSNTNGNELFIKINDDNLVITSLTFKTINNVSSYLNVNTDSLKDVASPYCETNMGSSLTTYTYSFTTNSECSEIRLKNISSIDINVNNISITTKAVTREVTSFSYLKDSNNKNKCSMQFIGRITPELYAEIGTEFGSENVTFGLFYGNAGDFDRPDALKTLREGTSFPTNMRIITEIPYESLNGYDSTGCTIDNDNPIYYQWGLSLNNISFGSYTYAILAAQPYVKVKKTDDTYDVYTLILKSYSVKLLCGIYYEDGYGSRIDRIAFYYLKDYWWEKQ